MKKVFGNIPTVPFIIFMLLAAGLFVLSFPLDITGEVTSGLYLTKDSYAPESTFEGQATLAFGSGDLIPGDATLEFLVFNPNCIVNKSGFFWCDGFYLCRDGTAVPSQFVNTNGLCEDIDATPWTSCPSPERYTEYDCIDEGKECCLAGVGNHYFNLDSSCSIQETCWDDCALTLSLPLTEAIALSNEAGKGKYIYGQFMNNTNTTPFGNASGDGFTACKENAKGPTGGMIMPTGKVAFDVSIMPDFIISKSDLTVENIYLDINKIAYATIKNIGTASTGKTSTLSVKWTQTRSCPSQPAPGPQPHGPMTIPISIYSTQQDFVPIYTCTWTFDVDQLGADTETNIEIGSGFEDKTVTVTVDSEHKITENDETNNELIKLLILQPDLAVKDAYLDNTGTAHVTVRNIGGVSTGRSFEMTVSWMQTGVCPAKPLPGPGQTYNFPITLYATQQDFVLFYNTCTWTFTIDPLGAGADRTISIGDIFEGKTVTVTVDSGKIIAEIDEDNNKWDGKLTFRECETAIDCAAKIMCTTVVGRDTLKCNPLTWKCYCGGICGDRVCDVYEAMATEQNYAPGKCLGDCIGCNDFDGKCVDARGIWYDYCYDDTHIIKYTCSGDSCVLGDPVSCGFGKVCENDVCIDETLLNSSIILLSPKDGTSFTAPVTIQFQWVPEDFDSPNPICIPYAFAINASAQGPNVVFYPGYPSEDAIPITCVDGQICSWAYQLTLSDDYFWGVFCANDESDLIEPETTTFSDIIEFRIKREGVPPVNYTCINWSNIYTIDLAEIASDIYAPVYDGTYYLYSVLRYNNTDLSYSAAEVFEVSFNVSKGERWVVVTNWMPAECPATGKQTKIWREINNFGTANAMPPGCILSRTTIPFECVRTKTCDYTPAGKEIPTRITEWAPYPCEGKNQSAVFQYVNLSNITHIRPCCEENWTIDWGACNVTTKTRAGYWKDTNKCDSTNTGPPTTEEQEEECIPPAITWQKLMIWVLIAAVAFVIIISAALYAVKRTKTKAAKIIKEAAKQAVTPATLPRKELEYPALRDYIKKARARGMTQETIRKELLKSGWPVNIVDKILTV